MQAEIRVATWVYRDEDDKRRRAYFGDVVELSEIEHARAERAGVFEAAPLVTADEPAIDEGGVDEDALTDLGDGDETEEDGTGDGDPANADETTAEAVEPVTTGDPADDNARPLITATKKLWVDYAVKRGMSRDQAEEMTRAELIAEFGA